MRLEQLSMRDAGAIAALFSDVFTHEPWNDDWSDAKQLDAYISDLVGQGNSLAFGYFDGGRMIGLSMGHVKHWYAGTEYILEEFCIDRRFQGRGVGGAFLREIEARLLESGISRIFLQTEESVPAYSFYMRNGFRELKGHVSFAKRFGGRD